MKDRKLIVPASNFISGLSYIGMYDAKTVLPLSSACSCYCLKYIEELSNSLSSLNEKEISAEERISSLYVDIDNLSNSTSFIEESVSSSISSIKETVNNSISALNESVSILEEESLRTAETINNLSTTDQILDIKLETINDSAIKNDGDANLKNLYISSEAGKITEYESYQMSKIYARRIYTDETEEDWTIDYSKTILLRWFGINSDDLIGINDYDFSTVLSVEDHSEEDDGTTTFSMADSTIVEVEEIPEEADYTNEYLLVDSEEISAIYLDRENVRKITVGFANEESQDFYLINEEDESSTISSFHEFAIADAVEETSNKIDSTLSAIREAVENMDYLSSSLDPTYDSVVERCDAILQLLKSL